MTIQPTIVHCFEAAGLGKAPFRYIGMVDQNIGVDNRRILGAVGGVELSTKPGGTCAYCGTAILNMFNVESSDGRRFHVGCECIRKTADSGLINLLERDIAAHERRKRNDKRVARLSADRQLCLDTAIDRLSHLPHPIQYRADMGETLADWARWMKEHKNWKGLAAIIRHELGA